VLVKGIQGELPQTMATRHARNRFELEFFKIIGFCSKSQISLKSMSVRGCKHCQCLTFQPRVVYVEMQSVGVSRPGGPSGRRVSAACPSPDGSSAWASAKGGRSEAAGDRRERGGNPAAFVFVPRPGRVRLQ
jgi:hypothetical protein